ncbi:CobW family GTP-binding protein [Croceicoccus gelatinilyticus]|uniref:CobW family GTP-binding protein n=1 Tax=Croceicoccus gelatinilyticus TaxID=2835536 RepID=UPI001BCC8977|nr:CobW family GTP-binding protein [Croceicoccus gelatinilyticus]MBS7669038.1 GTP-binding protein [Croceicoccus gelatinilyticus]
MRTAVDILTGFLGSGKTTLLNRMLASPDMAGTAVIVNELGDIALDHLLVTERSDNIALLEGGCLCCAVVDSLPETLLELCRRRAAGEIPAFDRIVIETTGLADPGPIRRVIRQSSLLAHFLTAGVVVTVVDHHDLENRLSHFAEMRNQIALADRLVFSKEDLHGPVPARMLGLVRSVNPLAVITDADSAAEAPRSVFAPSLISPDLDEDRQGHVHSHDVRAFSLPIEALATRSGIVALTTVLSVRLGSSLLRVKGIVPGRHGAFLVQGVGDHFEIEMIASVPEGVTPHLTFIAENAARADFENELHWLAIPEGTPPPAPETLT